MGRWKDRLRDAQTLYQVRFVWDRGRLDTLEKFQNLLSYWTFPKIVILLFSPYLVSFKLWDKSQLNKSCHFQTIFTLWSNILNDHLSTSLLPNNTRRMFSRILLIVSILCKLWNGMHNAKYIGCYSKTMICIQQWKN